MAWQLTEDLETFRTAAGGFLRARPAANTVLLTVAETLGTRGATAYYRPVSDWTVLRFDGATEP